MWEAFSQSVAKVLATLLLTVTSFFHLTLPVSGPCGEPLHYSIDHIDPRFQVTDAEVKEAATEAEALWENALHKNLFEYDQSSPLAIRFIYDDRQKRTQETELLKQERDTLEAGSAALSDAKYQAAKQAYEKILAQYKAEVADYNDEVAKVNQSGGASEEEYNKLQKEQKDPKDLYGQVEKKRQAVNDEVAHFNTTLSKQNQAVSEFNQSLETFQERYGASKQFDEGVYDGQEINIYQFADHDQLVLVLAHEMGHTLGLEHVDDPEALMYYLMDKQNVLTLGLTQADIAAAQNICHKSSL